MFKQTVEKFRNKFTPVRVIMLGFLTAIVIGAVLLHCPFAVNKPVSWTDSLFISTTSVCVTGLSTVNIGETFSTAGHIIILLLIQIGGLGFVTFSTLILVLLGKKLSLRNKLLIQNAYNTGELSGLKEMTKNIIKTSFIIEFIGALGYCFVFVPQFGPKGLWFSLFHSVSAFCNAGIDLLGGDSFVAYRDNAIMNLVTIFLIIVSGLGFPVYWEAMRLVKNRIRHIKGDKKPNVQIRIVILVTSLLILSGTLLTFIFEYSNPDTIGNLSVGKKLMSSLFQSVTLRTAGFATIPQGNFTNSSSFVYLLFMFIGGSPAGTAGGVKTVTFAVMMASLYANIKGEKRVQFFGRAIPEDIVRRCTSIITFSFSVLIIGTVLLFAFEDCTLADGLYEMCSAIATVGLSRGITGDLSKIGKLIVISVMYLGRIGPITLALSVTGKRKEIRSSVPECDIIIG